MRIIEDIQKIDAIEKGCVLSIGNFDGVHRGHQKILARARQIADERGAEVVILTFDPHPLAFLYPERAPGLLTPLLLKRHLLEELGVDVRLVVKASQEVLSMGPEEFIEHFLVRHIRPCCVVEGEDFNFGAKRAGDVEFLRQSGKEHGFEVEVVEAEKIEIPGDDVLKVSSTLIRYMLEGGEVSDAAFALGRCYKLIGQVVSGRGKGKELGFPTINMAIGSQMIVQEGVYAGRIGIADNKQGVCQAKAETNAIFSIGQARTFGEDIDLLVEAHVLNGNFEVKQGAWMAMDFVDRIRPQHKFASEEDLVEQIIRDCAQAEKMLKKGKF